MKTKINNHADACAFLGKPVNVPDPAVFGKATAAVHQLMDIIEARNKEADPDFKGFDWSNYSERKWFPWFDMEVDENNPSGFRFDDTDCDNSYSSVGSRLHTINEALCKDIATKHIDLYRDFMVVE